jgi:hypothetical protein
MIPKVQEDRDKRTAETLKTQETHPTASEKLCALASLRENSLPTDKNGSRKAAKSQRKMGKMGTMGDSPFRDSNLRLEN